jgi:glucosamine kinase
MVCDAGADAVATGVRMLGSCFSQDEVSLSLGRVARSEYMTQAIGSRIAGKHNKTYRLFTPSHSAVAGAVLMALERAGAVSVEAAAKTLALHPKARYDDEIQPKKSLRFRP